MKIPKDDDNLTDDKFEDNDREALFSSSTTESIGSSTKANPVIDCCFTSIASIHFLWIFRRTECLLSIALLFFVALALTGVIGSYENKKHNFNSHQFQRIYEDTSSPLELKLGGIDHWCLDGRDDTCPKCDDPTQAISRGEYDGWRQAFMRNRKLAMEYVAKNKQPDVIFLGDSLIEATVGTLKGLEGLKGTKAAEELDSIKQFYDKKFSKENGGRYDGLRLGIAGDTSPNLFWRIKQNEMRNLTPKVWWITIGRNDMFRTKCSEEVALMGVIRVVEELINKKDDATIVINSILPTSPTATLQLEGHWFHNDMYKSIQEVNRRLKNFAKKHHHVVFYDASEIFVEKRGKSKYITKKLYVDKVHPSFQGHKELVQSQLAYLDVLMEKKKSAAATAASQLSVEEKKEAYVDTEQDAEGEEFVNYDDYYGYETLFGVEGADDFLNDYSVYEDDFILDDDW